ncbi:uncharacterized protein PAF06_019320 [Gastrophryne carolinensis]
MAKARGAGDNSAVLERLRQRSAELGKVAVMGAQNISASPPVSVLTLQRLQEQIKQQKWELENRVVTDETTIDDKTLEYITEEFLRGTSKQLQLDIENQKVSHHNKSLALQRAQVNDVLYNKLLEKSEESEVMKNLMKHSLAVSSLLLKEGKVVCAYKAEELK